MSLEFTAILLIIISFIAGYAFGFNKGLASMARRIFERAEFISEEDFEKLK